jgi:hypothetical protein
MRRRSFVKPAAFWGAPRVPPVAFKIVEPSKTAVVVILLPGIDVGSASSQLIQHCIQVIHAQIQHCALFGWPEILGVEREEGEDCHLPRTLAEEDKPAFGALNTQVLLVPGVELVRIGCAQEDTPYSRHLRHGFLILRSTTAAWFGGVLVCGREPVWGLRSLAPAGAGQRVRGHWP